MTRRITEKAAQQLTLMSLGLLRIDCLHSGSRYLVPMGDSFDIRDR